MWSCSIYFNEGENGSRWRCFHSCCLLCVDSWTNHLNDPDTFTILFQLLPWVGKWDFEESRITVFRQRWDGFSPFLWQIECQVILLPNWNLSHQLPGVMRQVPKTERSKMSTAMQKHNGVYCLRARAPTSTRLPSGYREGARGFNLHCLYENIQVWG